MRAHTSALSLRITPSTFVDALLLMWGDKVAATFDILFPWLKALEANRELH